MEEKGTVLILLPGPPNELIPMFEEKIYPYLRKKQPEVIASEMVKVCGLGESQVETDIEDLIEKQSNPTIATYAKTGEVHLRVTAKAENEKAARKLIKPVVRELKVRFGSNIYTTDEDYGGVLYRRCAVCQDRRCSGCFRCVKTGIRHIYQPCQEKIRYG